jgi:hypothetical protein
MKVATHPDLHVLIFDESFENENRERLCHDGFVLNILNLNLFHNLIDSMLDLSATPHTTKLHSDSNQKFSFYKHKI